VSHALVELIDFPATVEALIGLTPKHTHFGRSLLPLIAGEQEEHRDAVFCEGGRLHGEEHCMEKGSSSSISSGGLYWPRVGLQLNEGPEHSKAVMCRTREYKYVRRFYESDELYDLRMDPGETNNRIHDPALVEVLAQLKDRLLTFYQETCDVVPHEPNQRR
jgi:arylsulfatase A-like enzyme